MPVTFPAHQAVVLPVKLRWPSRTDGTALCIGAAAPDLAYPLFGTAGHTLVGVALFAVPVTYLACRILRWRAALGVFANLPDAGPLRLHSYRVLTRRRPALLVTLSSAVIGAVSHVVLDAFTHEDRWGSRLLGLDHELFVLPLRGPVTGARALQYLGHVLGSLIAVLLFAHIGRHRLLERWYGPAEVAEARGFTITGRARLAFWSTTTLITGAVAAPLVAGGATPAFSLILGATIGLLAAGSVRSTRRRRSPAAASSERPS